MVDSPSISGANPRRPGAWTALAFVLLIGITAFLFRDTLRSGPASSVPVSTGEGSFSVGLGDVTFEAWLVARNAHTLARHPTRLFDTEHCAPMEKSMTLGVPMVTMGLLALPVGLLTQNPAVAYNVATALVLLLSGFAMYLLVREWTGIPAAGIVAGILFAFIPARIGIYITHPAVWDSSWLVFALFFSRRLFAEGRWRDAIGLAAACALQIGASFYPFLAAAFLAPVFLAWLIVHYGFRRVRPLQIVLVAGVVLVAASVVFGPYLTAQLSNDSLRRTVFRFAEWRELFLGGDLYLGGGALLLAAVGVFGRRKVVTAGIGGDPRWALLGGGLFVTLLAAGPYNQALLSAVWSGAPVVVPNFYALLASVLPGLDTVRVVARLTAALQVAVCILAGMGAAQLCHLAGRRQLAAALVTIGLAIFSVIPEAIPWNVAEVEVTPETREFFEALDALGNDGPILELPLTGDLSRMVVAPQQILAAAYHHRRTSSCFGSYRAPARDRLGALAGRLPDPLAVGSLRKLGFTTVVLHHPRHPLKVRAVAFKAAVESHRDPRLRVLLEAPTLTAYELLPAAGGAAPSDAHGSSGPAKIRKFSRFALRSPRHGP